MMKLQYEREHRCKGRLSVGHSGRLTAVIASRTRLNTFLIVMMPTERPVYNAAVKNNISALTGNANRFLLSYLMLNQLTFN